MGLVQVYIESMIQDVTNLFIYSFVKSYVNTTVNVKHPKKMDVESLLKKRV